MKLQNLSVIFVVIIIPVILVVSYYMSLQIDTMNMQVAYNSKLLDSTKEAIEAFEINTVEWNPAYSTTMTSKRRDVMASINTFTTSFANNIGLSGATKNDILSYVPAIAYTLYDGYYIYSPSKTKEVVKDENGVAVTMSQKLKDAERITNYTYNEEDNGKLLYVCADVETSDGTYNIDENRTQNFTFDPSKAKESEDYSYILKPFTTYSARYKNDDIDITVNYTLDNYITIYGTVGGGYIEKSGYLLGDDEYSELVGVSEKLSEYVWYTSSSTPEKYSYVYASDNTKVYIDSANNTFQISSTNERVYLSNDESNNNIKYKKIIKKEGDGVKTYYQALNSGKIYTKLTGSDGKEILKGTLYEKMENEELKKSEDIESVDLELDFSANNYYIESIEFTDWVKENLGEIEVNDLQKVGEVIEYDQIVTQGKIFEDFALEDSVFNQHKREVIKQSLINNLNQAITSYSRNTPGEFQLPVLSETDWDQILNNVSIITFVQGIPIGMKYYNNYAIATSTLNKEYVNTNEIYLSTAGTADDYYHLLGCNKIEGSNIVGYRNIDYVGKSYTDADETTKYYYQHQDRGSQACYYCLVQRDLFKNVENEEMLKACETAYKKALARERYVSHTFR